MGTRWNHSSRPSQKQEHISQRKTERPRNNSEDWNSSSCRRLLRKMSDHIKINKDILSNQKKLYDGLEGLWLVSTEHQLEPKAHENMSSWLCSLDGGRLHPSGSTAGCRQGHQRSDRSTLMVPDSVADVSNWSEWSGGPTGIHLW